jgi:RNA polymerase sigma factor (sigma-70 family)
MREPSSPLAVETLLEQRDFVRAIARSLLRGEEGVDDVEQSTWLAALRRPPRGEASLRAWLSRVVRNFVREEGRAGARRAKRERRAASEERLPSTADVLVRESARREVVDAVLRLPEISRTVVLLRWFDDLPPRTIARRLGVPVETVRTRLKRALELLREDLDARHGGERRSWLEAVAPLAALGTAGSHGVVGAGKGIVAMTVWTKCVAAFAAVVLVTLMVLRALPTAERPAPVAVAPKSLVSGAAAAPASAALEMRPEPAASASPSTASDPRTRADAAARSDFAGVVLSAATSEPIAGATVSFRPVGGVQDDERQTSTGADGRFALAAGAPSAGSLVVERDGFARAERAGVFPGAIGMRDVVCRLEEECALEIDVDGAEDLPIAWQVFTEDAGLAAFPPARVRHITVGKLEAGPAYNVWVRADGRRSAGITGERFDRPGERRAVRVTLERGLEVVGRVTEEGAPVETAVIRVDMPATLSEPLAASSDADGRYRIAAAPDPPFSLRVQVDGVDVGTATIAAAGRERVVQDFELGVGATISGRVADSNGDPIVRAQVSAVAGRPYTTTNASGIFRLRSAARTLDLAIAARGYRTRSPVAAAAGVPADVVLDRAGKTRLTATVTRRDGSPADLGWARVEPEDGGAGFTAAVREGRFDLELGPGSHRVRVIVPDPPEWAAATVDLREGETTSLDVRTRPPYRVRGVVLDSREKPAAGARVAVEAYSKSRMFGAEGRLSTLTDASGAFVVEVLEPPSEASRVRATAPGLGSAESTPVDWPRDGDPEPVRLVLRDAGRIEGRVIGRGDGEPLILQRWNPPGPERRGATVSGGSFAFEAVESGTYAVAWDTQFRTVSVAPGETTRVEFRALEARPGRVYRGGRPLAGIRPLMLRLHAAADSELAGLAMQVTTADDGSVRAAFAPGRWIAFAPSPRGIEIGTCVVSDDTSVEVRIEMGVARVRCRLVDASGAARSAEPIAVHLVQMDGRAVDPMLSAMASGMARTDAGGVAEFENLPPGIYELRSPGDEGSPRFVPVRFEVAEGAGIDAPISVDAVLGR